MRWRDAAVLELVDGAPAQPQQRRGQRQHDQHHQRQERDVEGNGAPRPVHLTACIDDRTCLFLLGRPLAAEVLLADVERARRGREIGDEMQVQPAELVVHLHRRWAWSASSRCWIPPAEVISASPSFSGEDVLAGELRIGPDAPLNVARQSGEPEADGLLRCRRCRQQRRQRDADKAIGEDHDGFLPKPAIIAPTGRAVSPYGRATRRRDPRSRRRPAAPPRTARAAPAPGHPTNRAGAVLRAGFTEVLVTGMLIRWMRVSVEADRQRCRGREGRGALVGHAQDHRDEAEGHHDLVRPRRRAGRSLPGDMFAIAVGGEAADLGIRPAGPDDVEDAARTGRLLHLGTTWPPTLLATGAHVRRRHCPAGKLARRRRCRGCLRRSAPCVASPSFQPCTIRVTCVGVGGGQPASLQVRTMASLVSK